MAIQASKRPAGSTPTPPAQPATQQTITTGAARFLAAFRVVLGIEFLWAFLDKTFGLGYATPRPEPGSTAAPPPRAS